jgi:CRISPR type I-E-associated protein CasB/Cse2
MGPGPRAELRRLAPDGAGGPAYWRVLVELLPEAESRNASEAGRALEERNWATLMALAVHGIDLPALELGAALAQAGFSPLRLARLLEAEGPTLEHELRQAVRFLASKGLGTRLRDLAALVFANPNLEIARRNVARSFYRSQRPEGANPVAGA